MHVPAMSAAGLLLLLVLLQRPSTAAESDVSLLSSVGCKDISDEFAPPSKHADSPSKLKMRRK